jgi:hypothetical protein
VSAIRRRSAIDASGGGVRTITWFSATKGPTDSKNFRSTTEALMRRFCFRLAVRCTTKHGRRITYDTDPGAKRPCPNPNVGYELGYAVATLGWDRVILLFNEACGEFPKDLPFDFIQNRASPYRLEEADPKATTS